MLLLADWEGRSEGAPELLGSWLASTVTLPVQLPSREELPLRLLLLLPEPEKEALPEWLTERL